MLKPTEIKAKARKLEDENYDFRTFLKCNADPDELDERFAALHKELFADYDYCKCANCCKSCDILLDYENIEGLMHSVTIEKSDFIKLYLTKSEDDEKPYKFKDNPCFFLDEDNGHCDVQEHKPHDCRSFPLQTNRTGYRVC